MVSVPKQLFDFSDEGAYCLHGSGHFLQNHLALPTVHWQSNQTLASQELSNTIGALKVNNRAA